MWSPPRPSDIEIITGSCTLQCGLIGTSIRGMPTEPLPMVRPPPRKQWPRGRVAYWVIMALIALTLDIALAAWLAYVTHLPPDDPPLVTVMPPSNVPPLTVIPTTAPRVRPKPVPPPPVVRVPSVPPSAPQTTTQAPPPPTTTVQTTTNPPPTTVVATTPQDPPTTLETPSVGPSLTRTP